MKFDFDVDTVLKMVEDGKMLKEIQEYYGCTRAQLGWFTREHGLNFRNNKNSRRNQSRLMSGSMNPTKGKKRDPEEMRGITESNLKRAELYWDFKFKDGITFAQYSKVCRSIVPKSILESAKSGGKEIDHIFSVKDCWKNRIHPRYASHIKNIREIPMKENRSKGPKSDVSLEQFLSSVGVQRLSKAQFSWKRVE